MRHPEKRWLSSLLILNFRVKAFTAVYADALCDCKCRDREKSVKKPPRKAAKKVEQFPPLSTSLKPFLVNGHDQDFRKMIYGLLQVSSMMLKAREYYGAYIGVSAPQYSMIVAIAEVGEATVRDLTKILHVSSPFVTAEINKLIVGGYVRKRPNTKDRRSVVLSLTAAGMESVRRVSSMRMTGNDMIFGSIKPDEAEVFQHLIQVLITDFGRAIHELEAPHWWSDKNNDAT